VEEEGEAGYLSQSRHHIQRILAGEQGRPAPAIFATQQAFWRERNDGEPPDGAWAPIIELGLVL
jgi:hypothetical protein